MWERMKWLLTRPRVLFRAGSKLGWPTAFRLIYIRFATPKNSTHILSIPRFKFPVTIRGGDSTDAVVMYQVMVMREYDFGDKLESPKFIIDGGANIGIASVTFLNEYPEARVVAVEPEPSNFELCRKNLAPYSDRVTLLHGAVWKTSGRLVLDAHEESWANEVHEAPDGQVGSVEAFSVPALIAYGPGEVDLFKVDIEGSEKEVFGPGAEDWLPKVRNIAIDLHDKECTDRFFAALKGFQFDLPKQLKDNVTVCRHLRPRLEAASQN